MMEVVTHGPCLQNTRGSKGVITTTPFHFSHLMLVIAPFQWVVNSEAVFCLFLQLHPIFNHWPNAFEYSLQ